MTPFDKLHIELLSDTLKEVCEKNNSETPEKIINIITDTLKVLKPIEVGLILNNIQALDSADSFFFIRKIIRHLKDVQSKEWIQQLLIIDDKENHFGTKGM